MLFLIIKWVGWLSNCFFWMALDSNLSGFSQNPKNIFCGLVITIYNYFLFKKPTNCIVILWCKNSYKFYESLCRNDDNVLLSARPWTETCIMQNRKSFKSALSRIEVTDYWSLRNIRNKMFKYFIVLKQTKKI